MKIRTLLVVLLAGAVSCLAAEINPARFRFLLKIPVPCRNSVDTLLHWQKSFDNMKMSDLQERFGKPDKIEDLGKTVHFVPEKSMLLLTYRLSRRSEIQFQIDDGRVSATSCILRPSDDEDGPVEN